MATDELSVLRTIDSALTSLDDSDARIRVLQWLWSKYGNDRSDSKSSINTGLSPSAQNPETTVLDDEIPGIAKLSENGDLVLTIRNVKAANKNDAAIRLVHIAIRSYQLLTNEDSVSSKGIITPILKEWRAYDGNTRRVISQHKGIIRNGDFLTLDVHSKQEAEQYIKEVLDESVEGKWSPIKSTTKKKRNRKK